MIRLGIITALLLGAISLIGLSSPVYAQTAQDICIARWVWNDEDRTDQFWESPFDAIGTLDLRSKPQRTAAGGDPQGWGIFSYDRSMATTGMHCLGADLDAPMTDAQVKTIGILTGLGLDALEAQTMRQVIAELLIEEADPTGVERWKPLQMTRQHGASIVLPGYGEIYNEPFSGVSRALQATLDVRWADYRQHKSDGVPLDVLQKWTGADGIKLFGHLPTSDELDRLLPPEYRRDGFLQPETVLTDSMVDTASTTLDAHTPTPSGGFTWATPQNGFTFTSGTEIAPDVSSDNTARASASLSSADHYSQVLVTVTSGSARRYGGPMVRYAAAAEDFYMFRIHVNDGTWQNQIRRTEAGTATVILTETSTNYNVTPVTAYLEIIGSTLDAKVNGSSIGIGGSDTVITGNLQVGFHGRHGDTKLGAWEGGDFAPAVARRVIRIN